MFKLKAFLNFSKRAFFATFLHCEFSMAIALSVVDNFVCTLFQGYSGRAQKEMQESRAKAAKSRAAVGKIIDIITKIEMNKHHYILFYYFVCTL